jgi:hypothetical protein
MLALLPLLAMLAGASGEAKVKMYVCMLVKIVMCPFGCNDPCCSLMSFQPYLLIVY